MTADALPAGAPYAIGQAIVEALHADTLPGMLKPAH